MRVLALDFGGRTGFAVGDSKVQAKVPGIFHSGTWDIAPRRGESPGMRYLHLRAELEKVLAAFPDLKVVAYEQAHHRGGAAVEYAVGCATTLQAWCAEKRLEHVPVHSATIKKHATGKGNAKKPDMMNAAMARGWKPSDDNEADALWLLDHVLKERVA